MPGNLLYARMGRDVFRSVGAISFQTDVMRNTSQKKQQSLPKSITDNLKKMSQYLQEQVKSKPAPAQEKYMALRLWQLDNDYDFRALANDVVTLMVFLAGTMTDQSSGKERKINYGYIEMMFGIFQFFDDLDRHHCGSR